MKNLRLLFILAFTLVIPTLVLTSCSDDDDTPDFKKEIVAKWSQTNKANSNIETTLATLEKVEGLDAELVASLKTAVNGLLGNMPYVVGSVVEFKSDNELVITNEIFDNDITGTYSLSGKVLTTTVDQIDAKYDIDITGNTLKMAINKDFVMDMIAKFITLNDTQKILIKGAVNTLKYEVSLTKVVETAE